MALLSIVLARAHFPNFVIPAGDLWSAYQVDSLGNNRFTSIEALPNHNILVGGAYIWATTIQGFRFQFRRPWFLLLDSVGTILKETLYDSTYVGGGNMFADVNGGYYHWGGKDSLPRLYPNGITTQGNWPSYVAHLDSNFKLDWRVSFIHFPANFSDIWRVIQLKDSGYS